LSFRHRHLFTSSAVAAILHPKGDSRSGLSKPVANVNNENMKIRHLEESDYDRIIPLVDLWWGGRHVSHLLPRLFFAHFCTTSFAVEEDGNVIAFLVGFVSQTFPHQAYIHFVGIHPDHRNRGLGRLLYSRLFETVGRLGCATVRCITSPVNTGSIAFHTRMGFQIEHITGQQNGVPCTVDYEGDDEDRVLFVKSISS
jgi:ribosomal protein S18 acetylase RimI-like enzyme